MGVLLLAPQRLSAFTPESFKEYVKSLYLKRAPKPAKKKRLRDFKVTVRKLKSGKISIKTKRSPKYVTRAEYVALCVTYPENELFIALRAAETHIYEDHGEAERIRAECAQIPW